MSAVELQTIVSGPTFPPLEHIKASSSVPRTATTPFNALCSAEFNPIAPRFFDFIHSNTSATTSHLPPAALTSSPLLQPPTHPAHGSVHPSPTISAANPSPNIQRQQRSVASPRHQQHLQQQQQQQQHFTQQQQQQLHYQQSHQAPPPQSQPQPQPPPPQQQQVPPAAAASQSIKRKRSVDDNDQGRSMTEVKQPFFVRPEDLYTSPPLPLPTSLDFAQTAAEPVNMAGFYTGGSPYQSNRAPVLPSQQQASRRVSAPEPAGPRPRQMPSVSPGTRYSEPPHQYAQNQNSAYSSYANQTYGYQNVRGFPPQPPQSYSSSMTPPPHTSMPETFAPTFHGRYSYPQPSLPQMPPPSGPVEAPRQKPRCWEHGCNGREFSTFSNLLRHQREKSGKATKSYCPRCGAEFTRSTAMSNHLQQAKCKPHSGAER